MIQNRTQQIVLLDAENITRNRNAGLMQIALIVIMAIVIGEVLVNRKQKQHAHRIVLKIQNRVMMGEMMVVTRAMINVLIHVIA